VSCPPTLSWAFKFAADGLGITVLPLWSAGRSDVRDALVRVLPLWKPEPITLCALFFGPSRLTPKGEALLDFLGEYIGTERFPGFRISQRRAALQTHRFTLRIEKDLRTGRDERLAAVAGVARANSPMLVVLSGSQPYPRIEIEVSHRLRFPFPTAQGR
jgi:hypothetical protein